MMSVRTVFKQVIEMACLSKTSPVAVAVSGGCDSMALLWMAKQAFPNVVGLTVDNKLSSSSTEAAVKAGEMAAALGVQHKVVSLEWEESVKVSHTRVKRNSYEAMLGFCKSAGLDTLMTAHHSDDQIALLLFRLMRSSYGSSSSDGLFGMSDIEWCQHMDCLGIQLVRPFLSCRKQQLIALCEEAGLKWLENRDDSYTDDNLSILRWIRRLLASDAALYQDLQHMHTTLNRTRSLVLKQAGDSVRKLTTVNSKHGYITVNRRSLLQLSRPVLREVMSTLYKHVSADTKPMRLRVLDKALWALHHNLKDSDQAIIMSKCAVFMLGQDTVAMCYHTPYHTPRKSMQPVPIKVGKRLHWMGRWWIKVVPFPGRDPPCSDQYFVRAFSMADSPLIRHGMRVIRGTKLPPLRARFSLPVIVDRHGNVVLMPHFQYMDRTHGINAYVRYSPGMSLDYAFKCNSTPVNLGIM